MNSLALASINGGMIFLMDALSLPSALDVNVFITDPTGDARTNPNE